MKTILIIRSQVIMRASVVGSGVAVALLVASSAAKATEHHFTYVYESGVLNPGDVEVEPWTTVGLGRDAFYSSVQERLEIEAGIVQNLQMSLYVNFAGVDEDVGSKRRATTRFDGVSWETKWKLADSVADGLGLAFYAEPSIGPFGAELEGKVIVDKRFGSFVVASNLVVEHEFDWTDPSALRNEDDVELNAGFAYFVLPTLSLGLEARDVNVVAYDAGPVHWESSVILAGPVIEWTAKRFWVAFTVMPQIGAPLGATNALQNFEDFERLDARLAIGVHL